MTPLNRTALSLFAALLALPSGARAYHLEESLIDGTVAGHAEGGSFGPTGWTVTTPTDRIWWALPEGATGSIELTVSNLTNANLFVGDNDFINLYDAADSAEPIPYRPDFVENNYKVWIRIRNEPGYYGNQKLTVAVCPDSEEAHHPTCPCGPFFVEEVTGGDPTWDGTPQRLRLAWDGTAVTFFRNGVMVNRVDFSATGYPWGPRDLHFSIGSTRSRAVDYSGMPVGAVISDVVVDTTAGPVASCTAPPPPADAGTCDAALGAIADGTAASWESGVYPVAGDLNVEGEPGGAPAAIVYLRFAPLTSRPGRALLRLHTHPDGSAAGGSGVVCRVDGSFDEATLTWASRPRLSTACTTDARAVTPSDEVEWDVTSILSAPGPAVLAIVSGDADGAHYQSRESGGCVSGPRLYIEPGSGEEAGALDAGVMSDGGMDTGVSSMDAGGGRRGVSDCGCRAVGTGRATPVGLLLLAALAALHRLRRARQQSTGAWKKACAQS